MIALGVREKPVLLTSLMDFKSEVYQILIKVMFNIRLKKRVSFSLVITIGRNPIKTMSDLRLRVNIEFLHFTHCLSS